VGEREGKICRWKEEDGGREDSGGKRMKHAGRWENLGVSMTANEERTKGRKSKERKRKGRRDEETHEFSLR
jgi:hypothetical protein